MSTVHANIEASDGTAGEATLFDSLARLVPEELRANYYRVLAHTRTLSADDEMLRILEAMGVLALLTRQTPKDIAFEREKFVELLAFHQEVSNEARQKMLSYVRELDARVSKLPKEVEAGLDPSRIAALLQESLRQQFLKSGISETVNALRTTGADLTNVQKELSAGLRTLSDSRCIVAQIETANTRLIHSLESRAKAIDKLLIDLNSNVRHVWIPLISGAALLIGMLIGMGVQGHRDRISDTAPVPKPTSIPCKTNAFPKEHTEAAVKSKQKHRYQLKSQSSTIHDR